MPDYSKGKIYMIEPTCEYEEGDIYFGSTTRPLSERMNGHRCDFKTKLCKSHILFKREGEHQRENKCVNKQIAGGKTRVKYEKTDKMKAYASQEIVCGCCGHYSMRNKHFATRKHEKWAETQTPNEPVSEREDSKDNPQNRDVECGCGGKYTVRNKLTHFATGKHTKWLEVNK